MNTASGAAAAATENQRKPLVFPASTTQRQFTERLEKIQRGDREITHNIPEFFARESSRELREAAIKQFNATSSDQNKIRSYDRKDWEDLLVYLKSEAGSIFGSNHRLFEDALGAYLFRADSWLIIPALRFAINFLTCKKYGVIMNEDDKIIKIIYNRVKNGYFYDGSYGCMTGEDQLAKTEVKQLQQTQHVDGLFGVLPEIKPILQAMLNELFDSHGIFSPEAGLRISYDSDEFIQVKRALKLIAKERQYDTSFLPFIEQMSLMHRQILKEARHQARGRADCCCRIDRDDYDLFSLSSNQAVLDEALHLMRQASQQTIKNGGPEVCRKKRQQEYKEDFEKK